LMSTPTGPGWFWRQFRRGLRNRDADYRSWAMPTTSNPHVPADLIEAERKRLGPEVFAREFEAKFDGIENDPCDRCGGPAVGARCVIVLDGDEQPLRCVECDKLVHADGTTAVQLWADGRTDTRIVILQKSPKRVELPTGTHGSTTTWIENDDPEELPEGVE